MLDKIVLSQDRRLAVIHFTNRSVIIHSDKNVWTLVYELIFEHEDRRIRCEEDTVEIDLQLALFKEVAA